ncbi:2'-5' RNA ligase family protein [Legionella longbeachae]|uniref:2'-5' RNA ligase family protein n=1 Tax=Legionella longbeachae TaxID=450 RepID=UPI00124454DA|nr:2'-5' RNA ligase family protein [Legionella longbeachae]QEY52858.1 2'-5' RNA ligase family protein [Legionella longbeachae]
MKLIIKIFILFLVTFYTYAQKVNVYLLFDAPNLSKSIEEFNIYLKKNKFLTRYHIEPFLSHHPLHITLFLADYPEEHINELQKRVSKIARHWHPIQIKTTQLVVVGGYVMLDVDNSNQANGQNPELQRLSDQITMELTELRNFKAPTPGWTTSMPDKRKAFLRYGSPNVFFEYNPHFTLMAKHFIDPIQAKQFQQEMSQLIQSYKFPKILSQSSVIAIGYVDSFGQITQEIQRIKLNTLSEPTKTNLKSFP